MTKRYDRRANEPLLRALEPGGFAHGLVEYVESGMFGFDVQFRLGSSAHHATLYVGTTKAVDLLANSENKYRVTAHKTYATKRLHWDPSWSRWRTENQMAAEWPSIEHYIDRVVGYIAEKGTHLKEGVVQAAVARSRFSPFHIIDREVAISYSTIAERNRNLKEVSGPWLAAAYREGAAAWWASSKPTKPSTECDLLGIGKSGELVAIEIKPSTASASAIAWAPLQARQYASQIQSWVDDVGDSAETVLTDLLRQKQRVGLRRGGALPRINLSRPVRPIVVVDSRLGTQARQRMFEVIDHLRSVGMDPGVDVYLTNLIGRIEGPIQS